MLTIILVVGYFLFCVGMAFFLDYRTKKRKLNETAVEYSAGKNSMGLFMAFSLMCGNLISSSYIIGNSSAVIEHDIAYQWTFYGYIIGWALTCAYIPIYRSICYKYGCSSLGEIFGKLFSKRVSVCVSVMIFVSFASAVSAQTVIVSNLLQSLLGIRSEVTMTVTIAAMILLALQGGMKGLARINMVHVVVLSVSVVAIFIAVMTSVGWDFGQVYRALEPQGTFKLIGGSRSNSYIIGTLAIQPFVTVVNALSISAAIGAKDAKTAQKAQSIMPIFAIFFFGLVIIAACCGKFLWPDMDPGTAWYTIAGHYGPAMAALASCGVLAASMSTAPTYIMVMSSTAMELYTPLRKSPMSEKQKMFLTKLLIVVFGILFQLLGLLSSDVVDILSNALTVRAVCGLTFTLFLLWKRPNEKSIFYSMVLGIIVCVVWIVYGYVFGTSPFGIQITYAGGIVALATQIIVTLVTTRSGERSDSYQLYKEARKEMKAAIAAGKRV